MLCSVDLDPCLNAEDVAKVMAVVDISLTAHVCVTNSNVIDCPSLTTTNILLWCVIRTYLV